MLDPSSSVLVRRPSRCWTLLRFSSKKGRLTCFLFALGLATFITYQYYTQNDTDSNPRVGVEVMSPKLQAKESSLQVQQDPKNTASTTSKHIGAKNATAREACGMIVKYVPALWETSWVNNIEIWKGYGKKWRRGCRQMNSSKNKIEVWLKYWQEREHVANQQEAKPLHLPFPSWEVFSRHEYIDTCKNIVVGVIPIEPLVGFLRHPLAVCAVHSLRKVDLVNKDYMMPLFIDETLFPLGVDTGCPTKSFFFDLGASLYNTGFGGASQQWFVDTYEKRGIKFDRILAWEAQRYDPETIFDEVPDRVLPTLSYFNLAVTSTKDGKHNPWRILKSICKASDFVVVKIDIDAPRIEEALILQLLEDEELQGLVDELYFEHHVFGNPVYPLAWFGAVDSLGNTVFPQNDIVTSYKWFQKLRYQGIRAHSWV